MFFRVMTVSSLLTAVLFSLAFPQSDNQNISDSSNAFAIDLYRKLAKDDGNIFLSPYSISVALAMTYRGARTDTEKEMARVLRFTDNSAVHDRLARLRRSLDGLNADGNMVVTANSIWPHKGYPFLPEYISFLKEKYDVAVDYLDYVNETEKARETINSWVLDKTNGKIEELLKKKVVKNNVRLILTNAIYFNGSWKQKFDSSATVRKDFYLLSGKATPVMQMRRNARYEYAELEEMKVLEMPYDGDRLSMMVILPDSNDGLRNVESRMSIGLIRQITGALKKSQVVVQLPKFKLERDFLLKDVLSDMGMPKAFSMEADFSGMDGKEDLYISAVAHKAFVDVNEKGTEAAAATAVVMARKSLPPPPKKFIADHPFLFLIRDRETGCILFMGRFVHPNS